LNVLVTGSAGFIGARVCEFLLDRGDTVCGLDNLNAYYEVGLKKARLSKLEIFNNYQAAEIDLADREKVEGLFTSFLPDVVIHLAAQAGVRHSIRAPQDYVKSNLVGFLHILEGCRNFGVKHLVYASSSSVYGNNTKQPFSPRDSVDHPISLYAASKRSNELMAHSYSHLFELPCTGLRYFTVYGPWGRPDMAPMLFAKAILAGEPIKIFNKGKMARSFSYIDDVVTATISCLDKYPAQVKDPEESINPSNSSTAPFKILNIGSGHSIELMRFIELLELNLGLEAKKQFLPMQAGDVEVTWAEIDGLEADRATSVEDGVKEFTDWYISYYGRP